MATRKFDQVYKSNTVGLLRALLIVIVIIVLLLSQEESGVGMVPSRSG
jgi:hypothetical protein